MGLKEEVVEMKKEVEQVKEQSFAWEMLSDFKASNTILEKANKRQFIIILVILTMWFCTIGYLVYVLNDIGTIETTTQEVNDVETINGSVVNNGDVYGEN